MAWLLLIAVIWMVGFFVMRQASASVWFIGLLLIDIIFHETGLFRYTLYPLSIIGTVIMGLCAIPTFRRRFVSSYILSKLSRKMPVMSATEREALMAGTVGFDAELFRAEPDWQHLIDMPQIELTQEEQAFMDGPLQELCRMIDDWDITHERLDMPKEMWDFIKKHRFFGMIIPKSYGGLEFSATAQVQVLVTLYGRSVTVATTVSVPNSLGPGELLLKYGTEEQKNYYLPRLAEGAEIPCFALTGPNAGSDAASLPDIGVVEYGLWNNKEILGVRLNWNKRYITLCPVATVIGLAFRMQDPNNYLKKGEDIGITCALIPSDTKGVIKGRRHFPLNTAFLNGPTQGKDVFIPMDYLIGGESMAGQGWRMLMECLSAGRAISLPSSAVGGAHVALLATSAYARVRKQFSQPIGYFEGIEAPLARIAGLTYMMDASLTMGAHAIDSGEKPSVVGAILKYQTTERGRQIALDAMDIHGGKGICLGPKNYLGRAFQAIPIAITVEGANILTRNLIIFGQGAIRCHPYVFAEMEAVRSKNNVAFDEIFWSHTAFFMSNFVKTIAYGVTKGRGLVSIDSRRKRYFELAELYSVKFAFLADFAMIALGSQLKRKERISARLGDILSCLYMISATLRRFHQDGSQEEDLPLLDFACQQLLYECELAIQGVIHNFPNRYVRAFLRVILQPFGLVRREPRDRLSHHVARLVLFPNETRDRLSRFAFKEALPNCPVGRLEALFKQLTAIEPLEKRVNTLYKEGKLTTLTLMDQISEARELKLITDEEATLLHDVEILRQDAIAVDDFPMSLKTEKADVKSTAKKEVVSVED